MQCIKCYEISTNFICLSTFEIAYWIIFLCPILLFYFFSHWKGWIWSILRLGVVKNRRFVVSIRSFDWTYSTQKSILCIQQRWGSRIVYAKSGRVSKILMFIQFIGLENVIRIICRNHKNVDNFDELFNGAWFQWIKFIYLIFNWIPDMFVK